MLSDKQLHELWAATLFSKSPLIDFAYAVAREATTELRAKRDELRALLRDARPYLPDSGELSCAIDAALRPRGD